MLQKSRFNQFKRKIYQINAQIVTKIILSKVLWQIYWTSSGEQDTIKSTVCGHRCLAKTYLSSVWEQYTICEHNYPLKGMYFEKHIEPVNDNNTQTAQFVVTVVL